MAKAIAHFKVEATFLLLVVMSLSLAGWAQDQPATDPCAATAFRNIRTDGNLFNDQQEEWLGEAMDQGMRKDFHVIEDPDGYLQRLGERLVAQLPPTKVHYRFVIIDSPGLNSFGLVGGRIYIYRRMIAFAKSEDELAALVGHEIGHMITHQFAITISAYFRELGITSVGDRQDVFDKWNRFKDNAAKIKNRTPASHEQQDQLIADRIGLYAMTRAGYDPSRFAEFADRSLETKGNTGGFWSDLFGSTSAESKRLREIMRNATPLPASCISPRPDTSSFAQWQQSVIAARSDTGKEDLPGLTRKVSLQAPLRNELTYLQFSPDGKYLLAQDDGSIFLLTREPFANLFRIEAPGASTAQFTPDASSVVFADKEMRVQKWNIATQQRTSIHELSSNCAQTELSPTGDVMACARADRELQLIDVASGETFFSKKEFYALTFADLLFLEIEEILGGSANILAELVQLRFSPDGRYLVAAHGDYSVSYDVSARTEIKPSGKVRSLIRSNFVFTAPDQVFGVNLERPAQSLRLRFPSGEVIDQFPFAGYGKFSPAVQANYVMVRPAGMAKVGAIDISAKKISLGYKTEGFAIYKDIYAGDDVEGLLALYKLADKSKIAQVRLPNSPLTRAKASAFAGNGRWLALSGNSRSAVWNINDGSRPGYGRDFEGAFFDGDKLLARFPRGQQQPGQVVAITPSPLSTSVLYELEPADEGSKAKAAPRANMWQDGDLLIRMEPADAKKPGRYVLDVRDIRSNTSLWQIEFEKRRPRFSYLRAGQTMTFVVQDLQTIKDEAKQDLALNARLDAIAGKKGKEASYLLQVYEARSHKPLGKVLVDTGDRSFRVENAVSAGGNVFVSDSQNRTLVYALQSGELRGRVFGHTVAVSSGGDKMLVENGKGIAELYDASTLQSLNHYTFPSRITHAEFVSLDKLLVLTADQTVYEFNPGQKQQAQSPTSQ